MQTWARIFGLFALVMFLSSAVIHLVSFIPGVPVTVKRVGPLFLAAFSTLFAAFIHFTVVCANSGLRSDRFNSFSGRLIPPAVWIAMGVLFSYLLLNFAVSQISVGGTPQLRNGRFVMREPGPYYREVSEQEYLTAERLNVHGITSIMLFESGGAAFWLLYLYPRVRIQLSTSPPDINPNVF
jgi:hypothetical protein